MWALNDYVAGFRDGAAQYTRDKPLTTDLDLAPPGQDLDPEPDRDRDTEPDL